jgi:hypothetical protein
MQRFTAIGTALLVGRPLRDVAATQLAALDRVERGAPVIIAGSPLADGALCRVAGERIEEVIHATRALVRDACTRFGEDPWSRRW